VTCSSSGVERRQNLEVARVVGQTKLGQGERLGDAEPAGEDYLQLNVLSPADLAALQALPNVNDTARTAWLDAIAQLVTRVETFVEDPAKAGAFKSDGAPLSVGPTALAAIRNSDTSVVDYALTATGMGHGWVTLVFGNGRAFTPT
jgi:hypothetical protein